MRDSLVLDGRRSLRHTRHSDSSCETVAELAIHGEPLAESAQSRARRIEGYDWIRLLAAINVIVFHVTATQTGLIGRGGVPAFLMIAGSLPAMRFEMESFGTFARRRARRILVPWLAWSGLFGAVAGVRYLRHGLVPEWTIHHVFVGTAIHLWFFPAVFGGTLLVWILLRLTGQLSGTVAFVGVLAAGIALFGVHAWSSRSFSLPAPYGQWFFAAPALILGVALGLAYRECVLSRRRLLVLIVCLATMLGALLHAAIGDTGSGISYVVAGLSLPAALLLPIRSGPLLQNFTKVSLGVYASHPLIDQGLHSLVSTRSVSVWFAVPAVFVGTVAFSALLRKVPGGKAIV
jgi:surface polysaccharide O-acyltransferase-like enzyme